MSEFYVNIALILVVSEVCIIFLTFRKHSILFFYAVFASLMLKLQFIPIGFQLFAWHFAAIIALTLFYLNKKWSYHHISNLNLVSLRRSLNFYFLYGFAITLIMWPILVFILGFEVNNSRLITQGVYFLLVFGLLLLGMRIGTYLTLQSLLNAVVLFAMIVAHLGLLQWIVYHVFNYDIFPIIRDGEAGSSFIKGEVFRVTSIAGEPKHLGILLSLGITAYYIMRIFRFKLGFSYAHVTTVLFITLIGTLSTTGIYISFIVLFLLIIFFPARFPYKDKILLIMIFFIFIFLQVIIGDLFVDSLQQQISKISPEVQDESVYFALFENPEFLLIGTGLGNIHFFSAKFIPFDFNLFFDAAYKPNSGFFFVLGDSGVIGLILLAAAPILGHLAVKADTHAYGDEGRAVVAFFLVSLIIFLARYNEFYFFVAGFTLARLNILYMSHLRIRRLG